MELIKDSVNISNSYRAIISRIKRDIHTTGRITTGRYRKQVSLLLSAAQSAQKKGLLDINKDLSLMFREQELMFASDLERKLTELDAYYDAERKNMKQIKNGLI